MKNKFIVFVLLLVTLIFGVYVSFVIVVDIYFSNFDRLVVIIIGTLFMIAIFIAMLIGYYIIKTKREEIKNSFNAYIENIVSISGVGMIVFSKDTEIIWVSEFIDNRLQHNIIGHKLNSLSESFSQKYLKGEKSFRFTLENDIYEANIDLDKNVLVLKDVTVEEMIIRKSRDESIVLGELEIDNFKQLQSTLSEEEFFRAQSQVIKVLDNLVDNFNFVYRQYSNGKYLFITNHKVLETFIDTKFSFLKDFRKYNLNDTLKLSVSIGIGTGYAQEKELLELAKDALLQAQARGGDQVAVIQNQKKPIYFGSKFEAAKIVSRVKIKQITKLFEQRLANPKIKNVIIYGHRNADLDAIGAALGVYALAQAYKKNTYIQNATFDSTTINAMRNLLTKEQLTIFIRAQKAQRISTIHSTLVVIVDTAEIFRIENEKAVEKVSPENIFVFDHHRVSKLPTNISPTNIYIDTTASSSAEIVTEILQFSHLNVKLSREIAQFMLAGIYLDTMQFQKSLSANTFSAAAFLEKAGAQSKIAANMLKLSGDDSRLVNEIISSLKEIKPGYFLVTYNHEVPTDIVSAAAEEILRVQDRKAAFVVAKLPGTKQYKLSARGIDTNVQVVAEAVGGGGHFSTAAATTSEPLNIFTDNIIQAIISRTGGK